MGTPLPAIGLMNRDGSATLSRDEVAWLREVFARMNTAYGEAVCVPRAHQDPGMRTRTGESAAVNAARHIALTPGMAVTNVTAVNAVHEEIDPGSPMLMGWKYRADITVIAGGLPPAPPQREYFPALKSYAVTDTPAETAPIAPLGGPIFGTVRMNGDR